MASTKHIVKQGESLSSIAFAYGLMPDRIWNDPGNGALRTNRSDPNVLLPGDEITIPEKRPKSVDVATGRTHRFVLKGSLMDLNLQITENDLPRAHVPYTLEVEGRSLSGNTDKDGRVRQKIPANAKAGLLTLEGDRPISLRFGHLDPFDTQSGAQGRLHNLGYNCGPADGEHTERTREALKEFQIDYGLDPTGEIDEATVRKLRDEHGS